MAKQTVSMMDRHIEKIVVGVAGLILLGVGFLYVVGNPHAIEDGDSSVGPGEMGPRVRDKARQVFQAITAANPERKDVPDYLALIRTSSPLQMDKQLLAQLPLAPTPINPRPPVVEETPAAGKIRLAQVLPPGKPVVFQGRHRATLPVPTPLGGVAPAVPAVPAMAGGETEAQDVTWVTVMAGMSVNKQREAFARAGYTAARQTITLARIRLERQKLLPDATWSAPEEVKVFSKYILPNPPAINIIQDAVHGWAIDRDSFNALEAFQRAISPTEVQVALRRQPLAPYLDTVDWTPPDDCKIEGVKWEEWLDSEMPGSAFHGPQLAGMEPEYRELPTARTRQPAPPRERERTTERPTRRSGGGGESEGRGGRPDYAPRASGAERSSSNRDTAAERTRVQAVRTTYDEAKKAYAQKDLETARQLLSQVIQESRDVRALTNVAREAEELYEKIQKELIEEQRQIQQREQQRQYRLQLGLPADIETEPCWVHDLTAEPGATYRYRMRFELLNTYAGDPSDLADPQEAARVVLPGEWSEWSEPVTVRPDVCFFFTGVGNKGAQVELWKWHEGNWAPPIRKDFAIGQRIAFEDRKLGLIDTGMTVVDIKPNVTRPVRVEGKKGVEIEIKPAHVLLVADTQGRVQERVDQEEKTSPERDRIEKEQKAPKSREAVRRRVGPMAPYPGRGEMMPYGPYPGPMGPNRFGAGELPP